MISVPELKVLPFGRHSASYNMAMDRRLLDLCEDDARTGFLRIYGWDPPALSLGFFEPSDTIDLDEAARRGVDVVRRPTGGRVVLHQGDLTYCIVIPRAAASVAEVYAWISETIAAGLRSLGASVDFARGARARSLGRMKPCFLSASRHEIVSAGRKVVGSAQRLGRNALLQHGSIPIDGGYLAVVTYMRCSEDEKSALRSDMLAATTCVEEILGAPVEAPAVAAALVDAFVQNLGSRLTHVSPEDRLGHDVGGLVGLTLYDNCT